MLTRLFREGHGSKAQEGKNNKDYAFKVRATSIAAVAISSFVNVNNVLFVMGDKSLATL